MPDQMKLFYIEAGGFAKNKIKPEKHYTFVPFSRKYPDGLAEGGNLWIRHFWILLAPKEELTGCRFCV